MLDIAMTILLIALLLAWIAAGIACLLNELGKRKAAKACAKAAELQLVATALKALEYLEATEPDMKAEDTE